MAEIIVCGCEVEAHGLSLYLLVRAGVGTCALGIEVFRWATDIHSIMVGVRIDQSILERLAPRKRVKARIQPAGAAVGSPRKA
jgi:hypothetical protein